MPLQLRSKKTAARPMEAVEPRPLEEAIRVRAYEIFEARGGAPGSPSEDWARAEREIRRAR